jgi:hypothetical protein
MDMSREMEGELHRTTWFLCIKGVTPLDIRRRLSAVCVETARACGCVQVGASAVGRERQRRQSREWHRDTAEERFREAIGEAPRAIAAGYAEIAGV